MCFAIGSAVAFAHLPSLKVVLSTDDMEEGSFETVRQAREIREAFQDGTPAMALFSFGSRKPLNRELCLIRRALWDERLTSNMFLRQSSAFDLKQISYDRNRRKLYSASLVDLPCDDERLGAKPADLSGLQGSPWGHLFLPALGETGASFSFETAEHFKYGSFNPAELKDLKERIGEKLKALGPDLRVIWLGPAEVMSRIFEGIEAGSKNNIYFSIFLIVMSRLAFGTFLSGVLLVLTLAFTTLLTFSLKAWAGSPSDALSDSLFLMIGVASLEDFVFLSYLQTRPGEKGWRASVRKLMLPGFLTSLSTFIGFISLLVSRVASIRELGLWAAVGAMIEYVAVFILVPVVLLSFGMKRCWVRPDRAPLLPLFTRLGVGRIPRRASLALLLVIPLALVLIPTMKTNDSLLALFPRDHQLVRDHEYLLKTRGWAFNLSIVFPPDTKLEAQESVLSRVEKLPDVAAVESGRRNMAYMTRLVPDELGPPVRNEIRFSGAYKPYADQRGRERASVYTSATDYESVSQLANAIRQACAGTGCYPAGSLLSQVEISKEIPRTLIESMAVSLLIVSAVLFWICQQTGQLSLFLPVIAASYWGPFAMLAAVALLGIPMNFLTSIFATVLVGLAGDNAVQFLLGGRGGSRGKPVEPMGERVASLGPAAFLCLTIMAMSCFIFLLSAFAPPRVFGLLLAGGLLAGAAGDVWIFRGLVEKK